MSFGLGGFAENEHVVDGDYEAFNFCLADQYYDAMMGEEWDLLDGLGEDLVEKIIFWLSYDKEIVKENNYNLEGIEKGTLLTFKGRTFIDAIVSEKRVDLAEMYIRLGVRDIRLYILFMLYYNDEYDTVNYVYGGTILNAYLPENRTDLVKFLSEVFTLLDNMYKDINETEKKKEFLNIVSFNARRFKHSRRFEQISLKEVCNSGFARMLINKDKKGE